jgi:succinate dehydrogenase flavin-adding protein (antitoxin of CptAB toxin-antitoxin module)
VASRRGLIEYDVLYQIEQRFGKQALHDLTRAEAMSLLQVLQSRSRDELLAPVPEEPFLEEELDIEEGFYGEYSDESDGA